MKDQEMKEEKDFEVDERLKIRNILKGFTTL
jgi:hypothetical protein